MLIDEASTDEDVQRVVQKTKQNIDRIVISIREDGKAIQGKYGSTSGIRKWPTLPRIDIERKEDNKKRQEQTDKQGQPILRSKDGSYGFERIESPTQKTYGKTSAMGFFDETDLKELQSMREKIEIQSQKEMESRLVRDEMNRQELFSTFEMFSKALEEYPTIARAFGLKPTIFNESHKQNKSGSGSQVKNSYSGYYIATIELTHGFDWTTKLLVVKENGKLITTRQDNNSLIISNFNLNTVFELSCKVEGYFDHCVGYKGVGDKIEDKGLLGTIIYLLTYKAKGDLGSSSDNYELISLWNNNEKRERIKQYLIAKVKNENGLHIYDVWPELVRDDSGIFD